MLFKQAILWLIPSRRSMHVGRLCHPLIRNQFDGLVQESLNSIANALELRLCCTNPSNWSMKGIYHTASGESQQSSGKSIDAYFENVPWRAPNVPKSCTLDMFLWILIFLHASVYVAAVAIPSPKLTRDSNIDNGMSRFSFWPDGTLLTPWPCLICEIINGRMGPRK